MRTFVAVILGLVVATTAYYYQNPDVVLDSPGNIIALASDRATSLQKVPDSFASITATSTPEPQPRTARPTPRQSNEPDREADSANMVYELEQKVHAGINAARARNGVSPQLRWEDTLGAVARAHSEDMTRRGLIRDNNFCRSRL